jgi:hypothetical protein
MQSSHDYSMIILADKKRRSNQGVSCPPRSGSQSLFTADSLAATLTTSFVTPHPPDRPSAFVVFWPGGSGEGLRTRRPALPVPARWVLNEMTDRGTRAVVGASPSQSRPPGARAVERMPGRWASRPWRPARDAAPAHGLTGPVPPPRACRRLASASDGGERDGDITISPARMAG